MPLGEKTDSQNDHFSFSHSVHDKKRTPNSMYIAHELPVYCTQTYARRCRWTRVQPQKRKIPDATGVRIDKEARKNVGSLVPKSLVVYRRSIQIF